MILEFYTNKKYNLKVYINAQKVNSIEKGTGEYTRIHFDNGTKVSVEDSIEYVVEQVKKALK